MTGVFVCVVGPSGAGKDTLITRARVRLGGDRRFVFPKRVVTREASRFEDHDVLTPERFEALDREGAFALSWSAHGLSYGIPGHVRGDLQQGRVVISNVSRNSVPAARSRFAVVRSVLVTAPREALRERILARGRESSDAVERRLDREEAVVTPDADLTLVNVGPVEGHAETLTGFLQSLVPVEAAVFGGAAP
jgi:ribose 1,5-bisphosphokinase